MTPHNPIAEEHWQEIARREIEDEDVYRVKTGKPFATIIDIGANVGVFSRLARKCYPNAWVVALEPNLSILDAPGVDKMKLALGNGKRLSIRLSDTTLKTQCILSNQSGFSQVESMRLGHMLDFLQPKSPVLVKIDCEGGERWLIGDEAAVRRCDQLSLEVHFNGPQELDRWILWADKFRDAFDVTWTQTDDASGHRVVVMVRRAL